MRYLLVFAVCALLVFVFNAQGDLNRTNELIERQKSITNNENFLNQLKIFYENTDALNAVSDLKSAYNGSGLSNLSYPESTAVYSLPVTDGPKTPTPKQAPSFSPKPAPTVNTNPTPVSTPTPKPTPQPTSTGGSFQIQAQTQTKSVDISGIKSSLDSLKSEILEGDSVDESEL